MVLIVRSEIDFGATSFSLPSTATWYFVLFLCCSPMFLFSSFFFLLSSCLGLLFSSGVTRIERVLEGIGEKRRFIQ